MICGSSGSRSGGQYIGGRTARAAAERAFYRAVKTHELFETVMGATRAQAAVMLKEEARYRPNPAAWLRDKRWLDEFSRPAPRKPLW